MTKADVDKQQIAAETPKVKVNDEVEEGAGKSGIFAPAAAAAAAATNESPPPAVEMVLPRQWFSRLNSEETMTALTIADDRVWQVMLLASTSSATTKGGADNFSHHSKNGRRTNGGVDLDWEMEVPLVHVRRAWGKVVDDNETPDITLTADKGDDDKSLNSVTDADAKDKDDHHANTTMQDNFATTTTKTEGDGRPDEFRIREDGEEAAKTEGVTAFGSTTILNTATDTMILVDAVNSDTPTGEGASGSGEDEAGKTTIPHAATTTASSGTNNQTHLPSKHKALIHSFMENTVTILPAALEIEDAYGGETTAGEAAKLQAPQHQQKQQLSTSYIALQPSYIQSITSDDLLLAFDKVMAVASSRGKNNNIEDDYVNQDLASSTFLEIPSSLSTSASFLDDVQLFISASKRNDASQALDSIPLYALILLRFQFSAVQCYNSRLDDTKRKISPASSASLGPKESWRDASLSLFLSRIRELEQSDAAVTKSLLPRLGKAMPFVESTSSSGKGHPNLEDYLMLPFTTVATEIMRGNKRSSEESDLSLIRSWNEDLEKAILGIGVQQIQQTPISSSSFDGGTVLPLTPAIPAEDDKGTGISTGKSVGPKNGGLMQMETEQSENAIDTSGNPNLKSKGRGRARNSKKKKKNKKKKALGLAESEGSVQTDIQNGKETGQMEEDLELKEPVVSNDLVKGDVTVEHIADALISAKAITKETEDNLETGNASNPEKATVPSPSNGSVDKDDGNEEQSASAPNPEIKERPDLQPSSPSSSTGKDETPTTADILVSSSGDSKNTGDVLRPEGQRLTTNEQVEKETVVNADASLFDDGEWETVGIRSRTNRKKKNGDRNSNSGGRPGSHFLSGGVSTSDHNGLSKKKKDREARKRLHTRKIAREILSSVLDSVEEEVERRRSSGAQAATSGVDGGADANAGRFSAGAGNNKPPVASVSVAQGTGRMNLSMGTMRDMLVGKRVTAPVQTGQPVIPSQDKPMKYSDRARAAATADSGTGMTQPKRADRGTKAAPHADQNTIPTVPETVSAVSAISAYSPSIINVTPRGPGVTRSTDSGSEGSDVAQKAAGSTTERAKGASPSPPLPTLLNPGNNNSSSSSVTSSLDAPHVREHGSHAHPSEDDVGIHLLDVCRRLSTDVSVFMQRREEALKVRRRERRLVLLALEGCLGTLWPGMCSVEMYGSCATNLDLPSSDLDVVVRGLDGPQPQQLESASSPSKSEASSSETDSVSQGGSFSTDEGLLRVNSQPAFPSYGPEQHQYSPLYHHMSPHHAQGMYGRMSLNAERVVRLSMELERQPWAVHVKAIPTATVPVIKILADPARVPGAPLNASGDWFLQRAPLAGETAAPSSAASSSIAADPGITKTSERRAPNQAPMDRYQTSEAPPLWRGADVNNGLLNVDITFDGPEHGGIGSTQFSARVIEEFAMKTPGLTPEETPEVQALMVLKELLAQRRLNEPFTGGLSSYALLLLVVSVLKEREIIGEELYKAECQRRNVAAGGGNSALVPPMPQQEPSQTGPGASSAGNLQKKKNAPPKPEGIRRNVSRPRSSSEVVTGTGGKIQTKKDSEPHNGKKKGRADSEVRQSAKTDGDRTNKSDANARTAAASLTKVTPPTSAPSSSWVSIARQSSGVGKTGANATAAPASAPQPPRKVLNKPSSFADAVAKGIPTAPSLPTPGFATTKNVVAGQVASNENPVTSKKTKEDKREIGEPVKKSGSSLPRTCSPSVGGPSTAPSEQKGEPVKKTVAERGKSSSGASTSTLQERVKEIVTESNWNKSGSGAKKDSKSHSETTALSANLNSLDASMFPHGFHDVIEVLCSGETTPGKLLMHFLLFYGQHFDSQSTVIDYSGTHPRDMSAKGGGNLGFSLRSPYMKRQSAGLYDPFTGMLKVDPIVVYDPLEGSESNNVARSCFLWSNVRWVFTQSYMTLSNAVEHSQGVSSGHGAREGGICTVNASSGGRGPAYGHDESGNVVVDPNSPLLELLLSF